MFRINGTYLVWAMTVVAAAPWSFVYALDCAADTRALLATSEPDVTRLSEVRSACEADAASGDPLATYQLALFDLGLGGAWDPATATTRMLDAAAGGVPEAQYWLAWQYETGPLLPDDVALSLQWYERAANGNHVLALGRLAQAYEFGELGLNVDTIRAANYRALQAQCLQD
jgi:TPR repeat protein